MNNYFFDYIELPTDILNSIQEFVDKYDYSHYARRGQDDIEKCKLDNFIAKSAEWGFFLKFQEVIDDLSSPDMRIYDIKTKSWECDCFSEKHNLKFLIKSCKERFYSKFKESEPSWIVQKQNLDGRGGRDHEFYGDPSDSKFVVCSTVNVNEKLTCVKTRVRAIFPTTELHKGIEFFQEPRLEKYAGVKQAIYLNSLQLFGLTEKIPPKLETSCLIQKH